MSELLALMDVGDMHLDNGTFQRANTVVKSHRSVGIGTCIEYHAVKAKAHLLQLIDQFSLNVALVVGYLHVRIV
jgi:hypothetical protein